MLIWLILFGVVIYFMWLFWGGNDIPFVGLAPFESQFVPPPPNSVPAVPVVSPRSPEIPLVPKPTNIFPPIVFAKATPWKSRGETACRLALEQIYGVPFKSVRPNFLKNPETGANLELDCYNESLKLAVEYNGEQHYHFPNVFHRTMEEFIQTVRRDELKRKLCDQAGVYLIPVSYEIPLELIPDYIRYHLPENLYRKVSTL